MTGFCKLLGVGIRCSCSCPQRPGHDVPVNSIRTDVILCSATFYFLMNRKVLNL